MKLRIADDLYLPLDSVSRTFGILAVRGAGKSNTAAVMAEEMFDAHLPFVAIDPVGSFWGLRSSSDGSGPGLPIPIFGGKHGDMPLDRNAGELIADLIVDKRLSCVVDLSRFDSESDKKHFLLTFARRLYVRNEDPLHLFLEEADDYIPQKPMREEAQLLRAWENIVRRGRARGLGITLITQRSAALAKMVLTQVETLLAMRTTGPQDIAAVEAWVKYHQVDEEVVSSLSGLNDGEAWVWSPQYLQTMKRVQIRRRRTFDSGATPKNFTGKAGRKPATLADVDLNQIHKEMAATIEKAKAEDPKELRKEIVALKQQIAKLEKQKPEAEVKEVSVLTDQDRKQFEGLVGIVALFATDLESMKGVLAEVKTLCERVANVQSTVHRPQRPNLPIVKKPLPIGKKSERNTDIHSRPAAESNGDLGRCERAILQVLSQYPDGCEAGKLTLLTGYRLSGGFRNSLGALRTYGFIDGPNTGTMRITREGMEQGPFEELPQGEGLRAYWRNHPSFGMCERKILDELLDAYPNGRSADQLAERTGYALSGGFKNALGALRTAGVIVGRNTGEMKASDNLFEDA